MAKDPAFLFYPGDFTTGTQFLTHAQVGVYMRLLLAQHQHGHLTDEQVIHISISYDNHVMSKFIKDSDNKWYNERLEEEILKRKNYSESRGKNRVGKESKKIISNSYDSHMENKNKDIYILNNKESDFLKKSIIEGPFWIGVRNETKSFCQGDEHLMKILDSFCELKAFEVFTDDRHRKNSFVLYVRNKWNDGKSKDGDNKKPAVRKTTTLKDY
jgi:uncharacterized protein YdaU (DUF1376 family)